MSQPTARHNLSAAKFPIRTRLVDETSGELLWERVITLDEALGLAVVEVPGFGSEGRRVRAEITDATGQVDISASDGTVTHSHDPDWPPS